MSEKQWFSTKIRLACLISAKGLHSYMDSIYVFRSSDFEHAFRKALEIGKSQESHYLNADQQLVEWKLKEILSLDLISSESLEAGAEVYSEPVEPLPSEQILLDYEFDPESSKPTQTI
jgi:hypothetical protein